MNFGKWNYKFFTKNTSFRVITKKFSSKKFDTKEICLIHYDSAKIWQKKLSELNKILSWKFIRAILKNKKLFLYVYFNFKCYVKQSKLHFHLPLNQLNSCIFFFIRNLNFNLNFLKDIQIVDSNNIKYRFLHSYIFSNILFNATMYINIISNEIEKVPSITSSCKSSNWVEKENFDLFNIIYSNNFFLHRLLTDYGLKNAPLKKNFPLSGIEELFYNNNLKTFEYLKMSIQKN